MVASAHDPLRVPAQFWQRDDVVLALEQRDIGRLFRLLRQYRGASQTRIGTAVGMTQSAVSLITRRGKPVIAIAVLERIADGLDMPDEARMRLGLAPKEDPMKRRTALGLGMMAALSPATLATALRESAAEAMDFTRQRTMSSVGAGTLDHLEAVVIELDRTSRLRPASETFPVARAYRQRVEQLIDGKHTLAEARELYVRAADLSGLLSMLAHDLGSHLAAEAYGIDSYRHAELAGHGEACARACGWLASWSGLAGQADKAIAAAERGLSRAPRHSPVAAQLHAKAARGYALRGSRAVCAEYLAAAKNLCERLPDDSPSPVTKAACARTPYMVAKYAAGCHNHLGDYQAAAQEARVGLAVEAWSPGDADLARVEFGIALAGLGSPDEAVEHGKQALAQPRMLGGLLSRSRRLDAVLMSRYPAEPCAQEFHEQFQLLASRASSN
jgi:transcriptional regulator with XRE-family HTH domain